MFFETITYTLIGKKHSSAAGRQWGVEGLFPQPEAGAVMQNSSTEPGTLAVVTAMDATSRPPFIWPKGRCLKLVW